MPQDSSLEVAGRIDDWWSTARRDILADPFGQMARAGLFQIGLPGAGAALDTYRAIAIAEQAIAAKTGLLGLASAFAARQMTARFFIAGFADAGQRTTWLPHIAAGQVCASIAISEPEVGAHPKHLRTAAESSGAGFVVRGRKAWVTNGPIADLFLVLAVTAIEDERKRYGLFLIPRETAGLGVKPMQTLDALAPASHCELEFDGCHVLIPPLISQRFRPVGKSYPRSNPCRPCQQARGSNHQWCGVSHQYLHAPVARDDAALNRSKAALWFSSECYRQPQDCLPFHVEVH